MRRVLTLLTMSSLMAWSGCVLPWDIENENGRQTTTPDEREREKGVAELKRFSSAEELEDYFKEQILAHNDEYYGYRGDFADEGAAPTAEPQAGGGDDTGSPGGGADQDGQAIGAEGEGEGEGGGEGAPEDANDGSFSETTIQEGVDEADVVKTDGTYLYIMTGEELRIVRAVPADQLAELGRFELKGWGRDLYLVGDRAVALTSTSNVFYPAGVNVAVSEDSAPASNGTGTAVATEPRQDAVDPVADPEEPVTVIDEPGFAPEPWYIPRPQTQVTIIDMSDRSAPVLISETVFDGNIASSRMIDGVLRLVLVNYPDNYYDVLPLGTVEAEEQVGVLDLDAMLPDYQTTDAAGEQTRGNIVEWDSFFRPTDPDGFGVTAVITLDTDAPETFQAVAVVAQPGLIYASTEALYVTDTEYYYDYRRVDTDIYKFAFQPDSVTLVGAGTVSGRILNQYSMGEYQGYLRVATTTDELFDWETGQSLPSSNNVYILGEREGKLAVVGEVEGLGITEQIKSARFIGSRGYVVTFRQMDPLFTLDLSEPTAPKVVGELKIPGFSTFIVPMDEVHLLTVGTYVDPNAEWARDDGVLLSIFDVSDFAAPQQTHSVGIGNSGTYSEATWDPKAFTYFAAENLVALPIEHWGYGGWDGAEGDVVFASPRQTPTPALEDDEGFRGIFVYGVSAQDGFDYLGRVSTVISEKSAWGGSFTRGVFIEDYVYAATDLGVSCAALQEVDTVVSTVELAYEYDGNGVDSSPGVPEPEPLPVATEGSGGSAGSTGDGE